MAMSTDIAALASADRLKAAHACSRIDPRLRAVPWSGLLPLRRREVAHELTLSLPWLRSDRPGIDRTGQLRVLQESLGKYLVEIGSKVLHMFRILPDAR
jgi:hypothetical protein